jgi:hypothetical protein
MHVGRLGLWWTWQCETIGLRHHDATQFMKFNFMPFTEFNHTHNKTCKCTDQAGMCLIKHNAMKVYMGDWRYSSKLWLL